jgi:eukaryotic-like serine/threonine-protein kinase
VKQLGADHPATLTTLYNLALAYQSAGKLLRPIALLEQVRDGREKTVGAKHPTTLKTLHSLALAYWLANQLDKSIPAFEDLLKRQEAKLGRQDPNTQLMVANLGLNYQEAGRLPEAIALLEEAYRASSQAAQAQLGRCRPARRLRKGWPVRGGGEAHPGTSGRSP